MRSEFLYTLHTRTLRLAHGIVLVIAIAIVSTAALWVRHANTEDPLFPDNQDVVIEEGMTLSEITDLFEREHVVRSSFVLYVSLQRLADEPIVQAGSYRFPEPLTTQEVARALVYGEYQSPLVRVTFPEGFTALDLRAYYPESYTPTPEDLPTEHEGYLFPDTYYIRRDTSETELVALMQETFSLKIKPYEPAIAASDLTLDEVIVLASIIEREAKDVASKRRVSGILQNRLDIGMALQVDATLNYILGKTSAELTLDDLELDSPFNTYTNAGLPPSPIANPGIESIEAVLYPEETSYLYYLTADDGTFYYARTFDEHKENKWRYLQ